MWEILRKPLQTGVLSGRPAWGLLLLCLLSPPALGEPCWTMCGVSLTPVPGLRHRFVAGLLDSVAALSWLDTREGAEAAYVTVFDLDGCLPTGAPVAGLRLSTPGLRTDRPYLGSHGNRCMVVWTENVGRTPRTYWNVIGANGHLHPTWPTSGIEINVGANGGRAVSAAVVDSEMVVAMAVDSAGRTWIKLASPRFTAPAITADWPPSGICITCDDTFPTGYVQMSADRTFPLYIARQSGENGGTLICSAVTESMTVNGRCWPQRTVARIAAPTTTRVSLAADASGGAYLAWLQGTLGAMSIRVVRITDTGVAPGWTGAGVPAFSVPPEYSDLLDLMPDGAGGCVVLAVVFRSGSYSITAQRFTQAGSVAAGWPSEGLDISTAGAFSVGDAALGPSRNGRMPVAWAEQCSDFCNVSLRQAYLGPDGVVSVNGVTSVELCSTSGWSSDMVPFPFGAGRCTVVWNTGDGFGGTYVRASAVLDDLTVGTLIDGRADCVGEEHRFAWRSTMLAGHEVQITRVDPAGAVVELSTARFDGGGVLTFTAACSATADSPCCYELREGNGSIAGSRVCAEPCAHAPAGGWDGSVRTAAGEWRITFSASQAVELAVQVFDVSGRTIHRARGIASPSRPYILGGDDVSLRPGWYLVRTTDGRRSRTLGLVVIR